MIYKNDLLLTKYLKAWTSKLQKYPSIPGIRLRLNSITKKSFIENNIFTAYVKIWNVAHFERINQDFKNNLFHVNKWFMCAILTLFKCMWSTLKIKNIPHFIMKSSPTCNRYKKFCICTYIKFYIVTKRYYSIKVISRQNRRLRYTLCKTQFPDF